MKNRIKKEYDLIIVGGGPSGMIMSVFASKNGNKVLILEKNDNLGNKLKITGGGRCNLTNKELDKQKFLSKFGKEKKFLFSPFSKFSVEKTLSFFEKNGLPLSVDNRNRVFPKTQKAIDVFNLLKKIMLKNKVEIKTNTEVTQFKVKIVDNKKKISSIKTKKGEEFFSKNFAIATGGCSHPKTGSTGDGFKFLKKLGHNIIKPNLNLVPLKTNDLFLHKIAGTTWSFCKINFIQNNKTSFSKTGKVLFTHFGLSSPMILNSSFQVKQLLKKGSVSASIDLFPDTEEPDLNKKLLKLFEKNKNKKLKNILPIFLQKKIAEVILKYFSKELSEKQINEISKEERKMIIKKIKNLKMEIIGTLGMDKSIVTDGGLVLEEINFSNMTSKFYSNLYVLGDILNINRPSGGYSLQLCWTTGFVAGQDIMKNNI